MEGRKTGSKYNMFAWFENRSQKETENTNNVPIKVE